MNTLERLTASGQSLSVAQADEADAPLIVYVDFKSPFAWLFPRGVNWCGIHDMGGNVEEWVFDYYPAYPGGGFVEDTFSRMLGDYRVTRGGAFNYLCDLTRCHRRRGMPGYGAFGIRPFETLTT